MYFHKYHSQSKQEPYITPFTYKALSPLQWQTYSGLIQVKTLLLNHMRHKAEVCSVCSVLSFRLLKKVMLISYSGGTVPAITTIQSQASYGAGP